MNKKLLLLLALATYGATTHTSSLRRLGRTATIVTGAYVGGYLTHRIDTEHNLEEALSKKFFTVIEPIKTCTDNIKKSTSEFFEEGQKKAEEIMKIITK